MLTTMTQRRRFGLAVAAAYLGVLAYATVATQCPVRAGGKAVAGRGDDRITCAMVHALLRGTRLAAASPALVAAPMRAPAAPERASPMVLAAAAR
jgi:hypothetical protein